MCTQPAGSQKTRRFFIWTPCARAHRGVEHLRLEREFTQNNDNNNNSNSNSNNINNNNEYRNLVGEKLNVLIAEQRKRVLLERARGPGALVLF